MLGTSKGLILQREMGSNSRKQRTVICYNCKGEGHMSRQCTKPKRKRDDSWFKEKVLLVQAQAHGQILNEEELAFLADPDILPHPPKVKDTDCHFTLDALAEVHNHDNMNNNVAHQAVQVMPSSQQSNVVNHSETEITSDSNIIPYSQYVIESQQVTVQNSNSSAQQDDLILSVIEQLKTQVANCTKTNLENKSVNDTLTAELERYKEQSVEIDLLKQTLSEHLKEKESLLQTVTLLKNDFKKEESRNIDREIALEKQIKQLDNIKAQQSKPKLYVGDIIVQTNPIVIPDSEETLALAEESQPTLSIRPTNFEVPKELPKVSWENFVSNQSVPSFDQLFELNELKAQSQEKDTIIKKLKERIKSLSGKMDKIKQDLEEIETINIELDHRVTKLIAENEHLKQTYKQLYDSIKPARIRSKEQCDGLINQVNIKSAEISDLNASLQEKALAITALKDELRKLKGKALVDNNVSNHPSDPELHQVNVEPITPKLLNKRTTHSAYIKHSQEEAAVLRDLVDHIKANYPLDPLLESACKYTKLIQEMLSKISKTCPSINSSGEQLVAVTPMNKVKSVRFTEPVTSSRNTKTAHTSNLVSNKPMLSSTGVKQSTSASGSQPSGNTKKDKIQQTQSRILKNKVEAHPRKVKSSLKNKDHVVEPKGTAPVQHSKLNANSDLKCVKCNGCMLSDNHDLCVLDFINNVNARAKSRSVKKNSKRKVWMKPNKKGVLPFGYIWRPTGRIFTIVGNACPLTRITTTTEVPLRKSYALDNKTPKPVVTLVYSRKPRKSKTSVPVNNYKVIKSVTANNSEPSQSWGSIVSNVPSSSLDECRSSKLSFVAFRQHTCYIRNLEGVDLLTGSRGDNLYTLSLGDMMASSPICLLSKASKTKSWLWHRRLSHLNFRAINHLARHGLVRGLPKLKFEKDHLCSACALGKSMKKPHKPKSEDTNQEKLYLLHMDLCGPMCVASVNGKKYILVIVDDYS
ncbi:retrovirus-related pol polyprotein from transposon TNT 1-94 [Tanacetum coccineum]